ncbi:MAG: DUF1080 domain-containing protein [Gemmataceae bacterium]
MVRITLAALAALAASACAADNQLTDAERKAGTVLLFDGGDPSGWLVGTTGKPAPTPVVEAGTLNPHKMGPGKNLYTKDRYANFKLTGEFKVSKGCNSGIFLRMADPKDEVQTALEIQIFDSHGKPPTKHSCGALYDVQAPTKTACKPAGEWTPFAITASGPTVEVAMNGETILEADLDKLDKPGVSLDGQKNKFKAALKDFPREGHIGIQDHGQDVWYKNLKVTRIK